MTTYKCPQSIRISSGKQSPEAKCCVRFELTVLFVIGSVKPGKPKCRTIVLTKRIDLNFSFGAFSQNNASLRCFRFKSFCTSRFIFCQHGFADIHSYLSVRACGPHEKEGGEGHPRALGKGLRPLHSQL